jgi:predicted dienelactone hydrolase
VARFFPEAKRPSWVNYFPGAAGLFILIHVVIEGYRWQMVPAYALAALLFVMSIPGLLGKKIASPVGQGRKILNGIGMALGFVTLVIAAVLPASIPVFQLPEPQGPYAVGVRDFELQDQSRLGVLFALADERRRLAVRVWYPAETIEGLPRRPYATDAELRTTFSWLAAEELRLPSFFYSHLKYVKTFSYEDAPVLDGEQPLPVIFFSHGLYSYASQNTVLMEHLASKGYVVFSIAHTYDAAPVIFPNGDVIELPAPYTNKELEKSYQPSEELIKLAMETGPKFSEGKTYEERYEGFLSEIKLLWLSDDRTMLESPAVWLADRLFVVDALAKGEAPDTIADLLARSDLTRVGHMGMSFGASTAAATAYADPRCVAAISLDGSDAYHTGINVDIPVPFMMLYSDSMNDWGVVEDSGNRPFGFNDFSYERFATTGLRDDIIRLHVIGSMHYGVSDTQLMMRGPLHNMLAGPIDGNLMIGILNDFVSGFFDKYLRGITNDFPQEQFTEYANDVVPHDVSGVREWWLSKSAEEQAVLEQKLEEALIAPVPK